MIRLYRFLSANKEEKPYDNFSLFSVCPRNSIGKILASNCNLFSLIHDHYIYLHSARFDCHFNFLEERILLIKTQLQFTDRLIRRRNLLDFELPSSSKDIGLYTRRFIWLYLAFRLQNYKVGSRF